MPDAAYIQRAARASNPENSNWQSIGDLARVLVKRQISRFEYDAAPHDEEGFAFAWAECRICGGPKRVRTWWQDGEPQVRGHGRTDGCEHHRCADSCPSDVIRMAYPHEVAK